MLRAFTVKHYSVECWHCTDCMVYLPKVCRLAPYEKWLSPMVGYLGGALTVATGVVVIPVVPYVQSLQLKRDDLVQTLGLAFTVSTFCLATFLHLNPVEDTPIDYKLSLIALIPALVGMWAGTKIRYRIPEQRFRKLFFCGLVILDVIQFCIRLVYLTLFINDFFVRLKIVKNVWIKGSSSKFSQRAIVYDLPILQQTLLDENHIKYLNIVQHVWA